MNAHKLHSIIATLVLGIPMFMWSANGQAGEEYSGSLLLDCMSSNQNSEIPCHEPYTKTYDKLPGPFFKNDQPTEVVVINGNAYIQGDIFVGTEAELDAYQNKAQSQYQTKSLTFDTGRWGNGVIPFEIMDGSSASTRFTAAERQTIINALNQYANRTNVCFRPRVNESARIKFKKYTVSGLGFAGGQSLLGKCLTCLDGQEVKLSSVSSRVVVHEVGHALGLMHEHTREDRDSFVTILWNNIEPLQSTQFVQAPLISTDRGAYDFNSVMHYHPTAFGKVVNGNALKTIVRIDNPANQSFGTASALSNGDAAGINNMYPTNQPCATLSDLSAGELAVGATRTVTVSANNSHNFSGIFMRQGQKFEFTTTSPGWKNGSTETTCNGYDGGFFDAARRHSDIKMMALTGEIFNENNRPLS